MSAPRLGLSGHLARTYTQSPLTPLLLIAALVVGLIALVALPREEEPQISVPMVDIHVRADGLRAEDAVKLVAEPLEEIVKGIRGVEHVYSQTRDDGALVTVRFLVGTSADEAILRVHEKVRANYDRIPVGIPEPLIVGRGIDDVPIVVLTLAPTADAASRTSDAALLQIAEELLTELVKVDDVGLTFLVGGRPTEIRVEPDPERLALHGITLQQLVAKVESANRAFAVGHVREGGAHRRAIAGQTVEGTTDLPLLLITARDGRPVYVGDVASVRVVGKPEESRVAHHWKQPDGTTRAVPAVSIALAKRAGANAVVVAHDIVERAAALKGRLVPAGVELITTRNYGETASDKADELLFHLALATVSIVLLVALAIGWRAGVVVAVVIPATILLTLAASWLMGFTINRVSLFALIFAIGILVDDAIVVIENIARHWAMKDGRPRVAAAVDAVAEVGNPTVVATLTVVVALLPMLFVSGLMGPYMSPIPANASAAMVLSYFVAVMLTPWLMLKVAGRTPAHHAEATGGRLGWLYERTARPVLHSRGTAAAFLIATGLATLAVCVLFVTQHVTVKLLPFDNKSEFQVVVDLPEGSSLEATERVLGEAARRLAALPEVVSIQTHAGTAAPFNFNGLVRHYYLRRGPEMGDLQVNLASRHDRERASHDIALDARERLKGLDAPPGTVVQVVEVPPGPPVIATLVAEIYGPDPDTRRAVAREVRALFARVPFIADVDDSFGTPAERLRLVLDQDQVEFHRVEQRDVYDTLRMLLGGVTAGYSHRGGGRAPLPIAIRLGAEDLVATERLLSTPVPANLLPGERGVVELGDVVRLVREPASHPIFRRDGRYAEMVTAELAGAYEAPIYGMLAVGDLVAQHDFGALGRPDIRLHGQPVDESKPTLLWDGEWEITYVTFRDMGAAFAVAILGIYLIVVGQFRSFKIPLLILLPVPLTLIGIVIGHWLFAAPFTATSMIGFIALAGIIVRNSILFVDFVRHGRTPGRPLKAVLLEAGRTRFKPILLTALAAMIGAAVILFDPIFQGLAISLLFGLASSTALTVLAIPAVYVVMRDDGHGFGDQPAPEAASPTS